MSRLLAAPAGGAASGAPTPLGDLALQMPKLTRRVTAVHGALFLRAQNGPLARWFGASILVLETVGRRTGRLRATPLAYLSHDDDLVVVPANAGADRAPAWWLNLQAAGQGVAILDNQRRNVRPRIAADTEHRQLWQRLATVAPIDHYQRRSRRPLPIVVLEPSGFARARPRRRASGHHTRHPSHREVPPMTASTTERIHDPVHRVSFRFETEGDSLWVFTWLEPGGRLPEHFHPTLEERWEVLEGTAEVKLDGRWSALTAEDDPVLMGCGVRHELRNTSDGVAHLRAAVTPAGRLQEFLTESAQAAREGLYNARNLPTGLRGAAWLTEFALRFSDETVMCSPPPRLQRAVLPTAARLIRWRRRAHGERRTENGELR